MSNQPAETEYSALQALLQIRTNASNSQGEASSGEMDSSASSAAAAAVSNSTNQNVAVAQAKIANLLRMGASPAVILQQAQLSYSPSQIAALRAVAAASLQQSHQGGSFGGAGNLLASTMMHNPSYPPEMSLQRPFLDAMARDPSLAAAAMSTLDMPRSPGLSPLRPAAARVPAGHPTPGAASPMMAAIGANSASVAAKSADGMEPNKKDVETADKKIRKDEVEAALRSKPQRGRKRENLNADERLELTRTRNREHAKSTRIRKKQRYQDLLDTEQKYLELKSGEELNSKRREAVMKLLGIRADMLNGLIATSTSKSGEEGVTGVDSKADKENRAVSFDHAEAACSAEAKPKEEKEGEANSSSSAATTSPGSDHLMELLESDEKFRFETSLAEVDSLGANAMAMFDEHIVMRFDEQFRCDSFEHAYYRVNGSSEGIALNKDGTGFARVELVSASSVQNDQAKPDADCFKNEEKVLISSVVSFQFARKSHKIAAVAWCILKDINGNSSCSSHCGSVNGNRSESTAKESLESQTVYPSVVSFDGANKEKAHALAHQGQEHDHDHMEDPGMSF